MAKKSSKANRYQALLDKVADMDLGGGGFWTPPQGRSTIRVLPATGDMDFFFCEYGRHYIDKTSYTCPSICTEGESDCPICDVNEQLYQAGEKKAAASFRVNQRFWMSIIDRKNEAAGPQIFTPGKTIFTALVALISDDDYGEIYDIEHGFDIKLDRKGEGLKTEYSVLPAPGTSPLSDDEDLIEEWFESSVDLTERISGMVLEYDDLMEKAGVTDYLSGDDDDPPWGDDDDEEDDEEEDSASSKIEARLRKRNRKQRGGGRRSRKTSRR